MPLSAVLSYLSRPVDHVGCLVLFSRTWRCTFAGIVQPCPVRLESAVLVHLELTWRPLGGHLESKCPPKEFIWRPKGAQRTHLEPILRSRSPFGANLEAKGRPKGPFGAHLESKGRPKGPFGVHSEAKGRPKELIWRSFGDQVALGGAKGACTENLVFP